MKLSQKNIEKIIQIYHFTLIYNAYRDFDLAKKIAKNKTLTWEKTDSFPTELGTDEEIKKRWFSYTK